MLAPQQLPPVLALPGPRGERLGAGLWGTGCWGEAVGVVTTREKKLEFPLEQLFLLVEAKGLFTEDALLLAMLLLSYSLLSPASHSPSLSALVHKKAAERKRSTQAVSGSVTNQFLAGSTAQAVSSA